LQAIVPGVLLALLVILVLPSGSKPAKAAQAKPKSKKT
jgi:hypothetical protein